MQSGVRKMAESKPNIWKGLAAGLAAGIAATLVMDQFQKGAAKATQAADIAARRAKGQSEGRILTEQHQQEEEQQNDEGSIGKVARVVVHTATGKTLYGEQKRRAGLAVHYTFGTLMGVLYGGLTEYFPPAASGGGSAYGTLLFLGADEAAVPALGLSPTPANTPIASHLQHWTAHIVYGTTAELVRSGVRRMLR